MSKEIYCARFWTIFTVALSVIFSILFFSTIYGRYGLVASLLLTILGLIVIWTVFFIRAAIFSRLSREENDESGRN